MEVLIRMLVIDGFTVYFLVACKSYTQWNRGIEPLDATTLPERQDSGKIKPPKKSYIKKWAPMLVLNGKIYDRPIFFAPGKLTCLAGKFQPLRRCISDISYKKLGDVSL